jgi:hypothetical protein
VRERRFCTLFDFEIGGLELLVKSGIGRRHRALGESRSPGALPDALRLVPRTPPADKAAREFRALAEIERHFREQRDPRFGYVHPFDYFSDLPALCIERSRAETLEKLLRRSECNPSSSSNGHAERALQNAGSWLRIFHAMDPLEHTRPLDLRHPELLGSIKALSEFLAARGEAAALLRALRAELPIALKQLPDPLPCGLAHSDFAPRNLLCDASGRISAIDTQAWNISPIYADLAHFRIALVTPPCSRRCAPARAPKQSHGAGANSFSMRISTAPRSRGMRSRSSRSASGSPAGQRSRTTRRPREAGAARPNTLVMR